MITVYQHDAEGYYLYPFEYPSGPMPAGCVSVPPEPREGFVSRWTGKTWEYVENHKGEQGWVNGEAFTIMEYGPYPEGWSTISPPPTPEQRRAEILGRLMAIDADSVRPLRAIANGEGTDADRSRLAELDAEATGLRKELAELLAPSAA